MKSLAFVYLLTFGGSAVALFRPFYGLLVYMCLAVLRPENLWPWSVPAGGSYSKIVGIALVIGWALNGFGNWNFRAAKPIVISLACYWVCIIASAVFAANQAVAWQYVELHSKILLPVLIGMTVIKSAQDVRVLAWTLTACLGYLAYVAHGMYYGGQIVEFRDRGLLGMDNNSICIAMSAGVGLAAFLGFSETNKALKLLAFAIAGLMVHVPMFGNSRGGMLGVLSVGVVAFVVLPKRPGIILTYAVGILIAIRLAGSSVVERFSTIFADGGARDVSAQSRVDLWIDCWDVMIHNPVLGVGPNHWPLIASQYGWPPGKEAHSLWFNCGAELGFVGLGLLASFYVSTVAIAWVHLYRRTDISPQCRDMGRMVIVAICGFMVSASFVSLDALEIPFYVVLIGVGALRVASTDRLGRFTSQVLYGDSMESLNAASSIAVAAPQRFRFRLQLKSRES